jgi:hypothetical protein
LIKRGPAGNGSQAPVVKTAKGFHFYVLPTGMGNRAGILPGVDFRSRGGYVLAVPSIHPDGSRYRWLNPLREGLASVPAWFSDRLVPQRPRSAQTVPEHPTAYGRAALRRELERLSQAKRARGTTVKTKQRLLSGSSSRLAHSMRRNRDDAHCGRSATRAWAIRVRAHRNQRDERGEESFTVKG